MTLSTKEIIRSKKHVFLILSIIIFLSGTIFGCGIATVLRIRLFDPMHDMHQSREEFIDKTAALAGTPEKEAELKGFMRKFFWDEGHRKFLSFQDDFLSELNKLEIIIKDRIPESQYKTFEKYLDAVKQQVNNLPPPPPPPHI